MIISIDSENSIYSDGQQFASFRYNLKKEVRKARKARLKSVTIPKLSHVTTGFNDLVPFNTATDGNLVATLTQGWWTPDEFIAMANTVMTAAATGTFTSTYNDNTNKMTMVASENSKFTFDTVISNTIMFRAAKLFGISLTSAQVAATSIVGDYEIDFRKPYNYHIRVLFNQNGFQNVVNDTGTFSFIVESRNSDFYGLVKYDERINFIQDFDMPEVDVSNVTLSIHPEGIENTSAIDFSGKDFQIVIEVI